MKSISRGPAGRRLSALLVAGALVTSAVGTATTLPAQAAPIADPGPGYDAAPARTAGDWLAGQLTDGLMHNAQYDFDDYGLSIDAALALDAVGGHDAKVREVAGAVAAGVKSYTQGGDWAPTDVYAGATAKATALAQVAGSDARSFGGVDLVGQLEDRTAGAGPIAGRIEDGTAGTDYANVIGQAFAARALSIADSPEAEAATAYLLGQQCEAGYFRLYFTESKTAPEQTCDASPIDKGAADKSAADTDVTAMSVLALEAMPDSAPNATGRASAVDNAVAWLLQEQRADGSFGGGTATEAPNTNSTGLAGWALGVVGETDAAERAAAWVRQHQAGDVAPCVSRLADQAGALGYDAPAFAKGLRSGIGETEADQWQRATAQALPVLLWAQPDATGSPVGSAPAGYVRGGSESFVAAGGLAPGQAFCASTGTSYSHGAAGISGAGRAVVTPTERTGTQRWTITTTGGSAQVSMSVLGNKSLRPRLSRTSLARGKRLTVRVSGLARGEKVTVLLRGVKAASGRAGDTGSFAARFVVRGKRGPARVRVQGQFPDRAGTVRLKVA